jgi:hypothetical protein
VIKSLNDCITIHELAEALGVTTANIRMQIKNGTIKNTKDRQWFIKRKGGYIFDKAYIKHHKKYKSLKKEEE